jgi:hypothetical protein
MPINGDVNLNHRTHLCSAKIGEKKEKRVCRKYTQKNC